MKKLMIAAATAALAAGAFAAEPQAYEMTLTVKASVCATNKKPVETACGDIVAYRKQTTRKYKGIFWGCDCGVIACPTGYYSGATGDDVREYLFWSETKGFTYPLYLSGSSAGFQWTILQVVGPKAANVEGMWTLALEDDEGTEILNVQGAGYGTAQSACTTSAKIKSMSGYLTGLDAAFSGSAGCLYCDEACDAYEFCTDDVCSSLIGQNNEAVLFGTWTLKFNSSIAKKLAQGKAIKDAYKFPKYVSEKLDAIAAITIGESEKDKEAEQKEQEAQKIATLKAAYDEAKTALETAKTELADARKALRDAEAESDDLLTNTADKTTKGKELAKKEADATTENNNAKAALTTATGTLEALDLNDVDTATIKTESGIASTSTGDLYVKLSDAIATAEQAVKDAVSPSAKKAAEDDLADYNAWLTQLKTLTAKSESGNKADYDKAVTDYEAKADAAETAAANLQTAQTENNTWLKGKATDAGSYAKAVADIKTKMQGLEDAVQTAEDDVTSKQADLTAKQTACLNAGGDCLYPRSIWDCILFRTFNAYSSEFRSCSNGLPI